MPQDEHNAAKSMFPGGCSSQSPARPAPALRCTSCAYTTCEKFDLEDLEVGKRALSSRIPSINQHPTSVRAEHLVSHSVCRATWSRKMGRGTADSASGPNHYTTCSWRCSAFLQHARRAGTAPRSDAAESPERWQPRPRAQEVGRLASSLNLDVLK